MIPFVYQRPNGTISFAYYGGFIDFSTKQACADWIEVNYPGSPVDWQVGPDAKHSQQSPDSSFQTPGNPPLNS